MPYTIQLSDATFAKLERLAKPFVNPTPESVVDGLANAELDRRADTDGEATGRALAGQQVVQLQPDRHDSLTHARLLSATVGGKELHRPKWNSLLDHLHVLGRQRLGSFDGLRKISGAHLKDGRYEESGFHYLPEANISIQGVDANLAWDHSLGIARHLQVAIEAKFEWRNKEGAVRPGQVGILQWSPATLAVA